MRESSEVVSARLRNHDVRRLRDLLRSAVLRMPSRATLPAESELMAAYGASRGVVRDALDQLREQGLIERRQGLGTHTVSETYSIMLDEAHGAVTPGRESMFNRRMRARVITREFVPAPPQVAERLEVEPGLRCLMLEYIALGEADEPLSLVTNYVIDPEASRIAATPFVHDWYELLAEAECELGDSQFTWDAVLADSLTAPLIGVDPGRPLMLMEQVVHDPAGRPFNVAFIHMRADRVRFVSRFWRRP